MLRVVFFGTEVRFLDKLRSSPVCLVGAYLPSALHRTFRVFFPLIRHHPALLKKLFRKAGTFYEVSGYLAKHNIEALKGNDVNANSFVRALKKIQPDLGVVANFGQILYGPLLSVPRYGFINFHPSLLPRFRGPTPLGHILLKNETRSGATWHSMTPEPDRGDILAQESFPIEPKDSIKSMERKAQATAIRLIGPLLEAIEKGKTTPSAQNEAEASYYPKLTKEEKFKLTAMGKRP